VHIVISEYTLANRYNGMAIFGFGVTVRNFKLARQNFLTLTASCIRNIAYKVKVKFTLERATKAYRYSSTLSLTSALGGGGG